MKKIDLLKTPAIYINLDQDLDKRRSAEAVLKNWGHKKFVRISANQELGQDHDVWYRAQNLTFARACSLINTPFIFFEDDIGIFNSINKISIPDDADAIYLGVMNLPGVTNDSGLDLKPRATKTEIDNIVRIHDFTGCHAILFLSQGLANDFAEKLRDTTFRADECMIALSKRYKYYAVNPVIFYQNDLEFAEHPKYHLTKLDNLLEI